MSALVFALSDFSVTIGVGAAAGAGEGVRVGASTMTDACSVRHWVELNLIKRPGGP